MTLFPSPASPQKFPCETCGEDTYGAMTERGRWGLCDSCFERWVRSARRDTRRPADDERRET